MSEPLHILAITAHPDDAELLMGGTLARAASEGRRVGVLDLTAGETGTKGSADLRAKEAARAAEILGLALRENLGLPDGRIERSAQNRLLLAERIRVHRPEVLLIHRAAGRNPDHHAASHIAREAAYSAGLVRLGKGTGPHRPRKIFEALSFLPGCPDVVVDITPSFDTKMSALRAYQSQFEEAMEAGDILSNGKDDLFAQVTFHNQRYGSLVQVPYGEPYRMPEPLRVDDLLALPGRSL
jgi:bacillithiol biosynthesis deacetylase BshB1